MGRVKIQMEYENKWYELDHYANWFFHIFMETNKSAPMYGVAPKRLASASREAPLAIAVCWAWPRLSPVCRRFDRVASGVRAGVVWSDPGVTPTAQG